MVKNIKSVARPDGRTVNDAVMRGAKMAMNCVQVGTIVSFNPQNQLAEVQIAMKQVVSVEEDGTKNLKEYPLLKEVPCVVLFGGVDILSMPITAGDSCLVFFNDRDIGQWKSAGNGQTPQTARLHDLSDAFAVVGVRSLTDSISNYLANGIRLSHGIGNSQIDLKDDLIDTIAELFLHHGDMRITQDLEVERDFYVRGETYGRSGDDTWTLRANLDQIAGFEIHDGRRVSGTFDVVTVVDGIVVGGS